MEIMSDVIRRKVLWSANICLSLQYKQTIYEE